jgi:hypothetical protein
MKRKFSVGIAAIMATILLSSCGKVPQAEIDQAESAIDSARITGAEIYVPSDFARLQDSMNAAMILMEAQGSKMIKNYGITREKFTGVTEYAREVILLSEIRKAELRQEIQSVLTEVKDLLDKNKELISQAPKGKEGTTALQMIKDELSAIESSITELESQMQMGDLLACQSSAVAAKEKANSVHEELNGVIARYNKARK